MEDFLLELAGKVTERGKTAAIRNTENGELVISHFSSDTNVDLKHVISNAYHPIKVTRNNAEILPVWAHYKNMFNVCDNFNTRLYKRCFPHSCGGKGTSGQNGQIHKFVMAALIQNIRAIAELVSKNRYDGMKFKPFCLELADSMIQLVINTN